MFWGQPDVDGRTFFSSLCLNAFWGADVVLTESTVFTLHARAQKPKVSHEQQQV